MALAYTVDRVSGMIGRAEELATITTAAHDAQRRGSALVIEGEPGIGKTTLLAAAAELAGDNDFRVLSCAGVQSQASVGYAGIHELVHPILEHVEALPAHQKAALLTAFGLAEGQSPPPLLAGVSLLGLIEEAAAERPLLLLVDDAQWLDESSLHAVTFVGRRVSAASVLLLCAARSRFDDRMPTLASLPRLPLGPADDTTSAALLARAAGDHPLSGTDRRRLLDEAAGNPLAIVELTKAVISRGRLDTVAARTPLPTTRRIEASFEDQLAAIPSASRQLLALIAAADHSGLGELIEAAGHVGLDHGDVDSLERAGLVTVGGGEVHIRHPLIRTVAYRSVGLSRRSAFHHALAAAAADPMRAAWQRAAAAYGPDENVAAELEWASFQAQSRGASAEAAAGWRRAAALSPGIDERVRRLVRAIEPAYQAGLTDEAIDILAEAEPLATDLDDLFTIAFARFTLGVTTGAGAPRVADLLSLADRLGESPSPAHQRAEVRLLAAAAAHCRFHGSPDGDRSAVAARLRARDRPREPIVDIALATICDLEEAQRFRSDAGRLHANVADDLTAVMSMGLAAESVSDLETAQRCWTTAIGLAHDMGAPAIECEALRGSARAHLVAGRPTEALIHAQTALRLATDANLRISVGAAAALVGRAHVWRGDVRAAQEAIHVAREHLSSGTTLMWRDELAWTQGLLALSTHDHELAYAELSQITKDRGARRWSIADLTEAAAAADIVDVGATDLLDETETQAMILGSAHLDMLVRRSRAMLAGGHPAAEGHFESALQQTEAAETAALEYARTHLAYGEWLRRRRRIIDARVQLAAALRIFEARGAQMWAHRSRAELRAAGVNLAGPRAERQGPDLTPQELQIARLAASGLTNRQIADQIYVSHRTVAAHLYKIFPKLGITSRNQLRDSVGGEHIT
ncbi:ATP-binding protein [Mycolicibacterium obuense]|uniref:ATP-binding protein n=1 Tax=Mycolicibacterium obuense TaxID=1807 RepID=UPI0023FA29D3|nr:helix-turn-helix transcriptional regulator [Mycolicibacterium obuense]